MTTPAAPALPPRKRTRARLAGRAGAVVLAGVLGGGYAFSDAAFFQRLVRDHRIRTPDDAWAFVDAHTLPAGGGGPAPVRGLSARSMLTTRRRLYRD